MSTVLPLVSGRGAPNGRVRVAASLPPMGWLLFFAGTYFDTSEGLIDQAANEYRHRADGARAGGSHQRRRARGRDWARRPQRPIQPGAGRPGRWIGSGRKNELNGSTSFQSTTTAGGRGKTCLIKARELRYRLGQVASQACVTPRSCHASAPKFDLRQGRVDDSPSDPRPETSAGSTAPAGIRANRLAGV